MLDINFSFDKRYFLYMHAGYCKTSASISSVFPPLSSLHEKQILQQKVLVFFSKTVFSFPCPNVLLINYFLNIYHFWYISVSSFDFNSYIFLNIKHYKMIWALASKTIFEHSRDNSLNLLNIGACDNLSLTDAFNTVFLTFSNSMKGFFYTHMWIIF